MRPNETVNEGQRRKPRRRSARPGRFVWTRTRAKAARLLAERPGCEVAAELGIGLRTLSRWRQVPEFRARVEDHYQAWRAVWRAELAATWKARREALKVRR